MTIDDCRCAYRARPARWVVGAGLLGLLLAAAGCQNDALARKQLAYREDNLARTAARIDYAERIRPESYAFTAGQIDRAIRLDAERTPRNVEKLGWYIERDAQRLRDSGPAYERQLRRTFSGQPDQIEPNAIKMFF